jgi:GT2 family glycosyltransferase/nucleoside-diphosphate-sugar epimerase
LTVTNETDAGRVTALVVNHNGGDLLSDCVGALLAASGVSALIVVDNASRDGSLAAMEDRFGADPRLSVIRNETNLGYGTAANLGLARVGTEFVLVVNPDCVVGREMIGALVAEADATPRAAVCGGLVLACDGTLQNATRRRYPSPVRTLRRALRWPGHGGSKLAASDFDRCDDPLPAAAENIDAVSGALMLVRMTAVREVGGFDEEYFLHCEDLDWCVRFNRAGWSVRFVPAGFAVHAKGASGGVRPWRIRWHMHRGMTRFYRKFEAPARSAWFNALIVGAIWTRFVVGVMAHPLRVRMRPLRSYADTADAIRRTFATVERFEPPGTLVIGASSAVARYLLDHPAEASGGYLAVSRAEAPVHIGEGIVRMRSADGGNLPSWARAGVRQVVHLAPLWTLPAYLENLADVPIARVVACSSTSVVTRRDAAGGFTDDLARRLAEAEAAVREHCASRGIELVLLRPTLIYAPGEDRNVERIARLVRRLGFFPLAGEGRGLRQPVHAEDVADAVRASLRSPVAPGRCYTVSGAEVLTYREMVSRVFRAVGRRPRFLSIPLQPYRLLLLSLGWISGAAAIDPGAAARMDDDHAFDHEAAARDLGFSPRAFLEG